MDLSIVVSTRDRGERVLPAVESVLRDQGCRWELIIVDQSSSGSTEAALGARGVLKDHRLTYRRTTATGLSRGRNEGLRYARGDVVAFTDDDCLVPAGWGGELVRRFASMPEVAILYASVVAPANAAEGWVPEFHPLREGLVRLSPGIVRDLGLGANFAVRSSAVATIGPFDEVLGAGEAFGAAEDTDFGYRALRRGLEVYTAREPAVIHCGVRRGGEISATASQYVRGMAAMCMKHVRCGDRQMLAPITASLRKRVGEGVGHLMRGQRPAGFRAAGAALQGMLGSFRYSVDRERRLYRPRPDGSRGTMNRDG